MLAITCLCPWNWAFSFPFFFLLPLNTAAVLSSAFVMVWDDIIAALVPFKGFHFVKAKSSVGRGHSLVLVWGAKVWNAEIICSSAKIWRHDGVDRGTSNSIFKDFVVRRTILCFAFFFFLVIIFFKVCSFVFKDLVFINGMFHALISSWCSRREFQWLIHYNHANFPLFIFINPTPNITNFTASITHLKGVQLKKRQSQQLTLHDFKKKERKDKNTERSFKKLKSANYFC